MDWGHLHHEYLKIMQQISIGLPKGTLEQRHECKGCTLGNYTKYSSHDNDNRVQAIFDRVHSDVCGPFSIASMAKHNYCVIVFDDFSRKCWIFFM